MRANHHHFGAPLGGVALQGCGHVFTHALGFHQGGFLRHAFLGECGSGFFQQCRAGLDERLAQFARIVITDIEQHGRAVDDVHGAHGAVECLGQAHGFGQGQFAGFAAVYGDQDLVVHGSSLTGESLSESCYGTVGPARRYSVTSTALLRCAKSDGRDHATQQCTAIRLLSRPS